MPVLRSWRRGLVWKAPPPVPALLGFKSTFDIEQRKVCESSRAAVWDNVGDSPSLPPFPHLSPCPIASSIPAPR
ncbi:hypothetical protein E2C01_066641 [Portunus trituberculatus]|uniref:Uncharacterized protein n=1 Tax=Portunus trituberculatus TaxID=210409 RepID=A0A5B7HRF6_PORTR|nr:hypothetical protein [Portunus trituberculatus]